MQQIESVTARGGAMRARRAPVAVGSRSGWRRAQRFFGRWLALLVLCFATPGVAAVTQELLPQASLVDCCDDGACDESTGQCCPRSCLHCACCAHPSAVPMPAQLLPLAPATSLQGFAETRDGRAVSGYRAPPFRPPAG